jgi:heptosyltransferase III
VEAVTPDFGLVLQPEAVNHVAGLLKGKGVDGPFAVIHPGSGGSARDWPLERFGDLGRMIATKYGVRVLVTGGEREHEATALVAERAGAGAISLCGALTLPELAALYARAAVVIANSTGPLHLAAALGTAVVGIYPQLTAMSPARWGPYTDRKRVLVPDAPADCRLCRKGERCACIESITREQVYDAAGSFLSNDSQDGTREGTHE